MALLDGMNNMNNRQLGLRTLALLALVIATTAVLVHPDSVGAIGSIRVLAQH